MTEATELERLRGRLERAERLLACYQQALGHELPNQLVAIQGLVRVLELEEPERLTAEGREYLDRLGGLARRAHELARALAEVGRVTREGQPVEAVALDEAAREAVAEINLLCPGLRIEYDFPDQVPTLTVARPALRLVLMQLLRHAARNASEDHPVCIHLGALRTDAAVELWVADDGRELSPEQLQHLFEPFASGRPASGSGLGLFLVRQVVESWGGIVRVQSEVGHGSTITISMFSGEPQATAPGHLRLPAKRDES